LSLQSSMTLIEFIEFGKKQLGTNPDWYNSIGTTGQR
jgi:hypothetical protein